MSIADVPLGPLAPRCATHPEEAAGGTCSRCGTFFCTHCVQWVLGKAYCPACAARPEINYLEQLRLKLWGRRDAWAWSIGAVGLGLIAASGPLLWRQELGLGLILGACGGVGVAFFLGLRWAREALVATPLVLGLVSGLFLGPLGVVGLGFLFFTSLSIYFDSRNQLFFRRQLSPERLQRLWHRHENNPRAREALSLGAGAIVLPPLAPLAILLGVVALRRVDPSATPPIGRKGEALAAIALGVGVLVVWAVLLWPALHERLLLHLQE